LGFQHISNRAVFTAVLSTGVLVVSIGLAYLTAGQQEFPRLLVDSFPFIEWVNTAQDWLRQNVRGVTRSIAGVIGDSLDAVETFMLDLSWPIVTLGFALPALRYGGLRLALFCVVAILFWGATDMWDPAMETLSLMFVSVIIASTLGILIGIAASQSNRVDAWTRPILDTMQTLPGFVYLTPAIFFFGIGGPPAIIAVVIYALPPAARLTNLGIRQVPSETIEAARSFGSTSRQLLFKVKLPLALPSILMGVNQTIMMALGLVVLAAFIGAAGLGYEVWQALRRLNIGWGIEGGLSIVFMAIMFDRISGAMGSYRRSEPSIEEEHFRLLPVRLVNTPWAQRFESVLGRLFRIFAVLSQRFARWVASVFRYALQLVSSTVADQVEGYLLRHTFLLMSISLLVILYLCDSYLFSIGDFPTDLEISIRGPADAGLDWLKTNVTFIAFTTWIRGFVFIWLLDPLAKFLQALPWWYVMGFLVLVVWFSCGLSTTIVALAGLLFIGCADLWPIAMFTMAQILVSLLLCMLVGIPIGVLTAINDTFEMLLRPILDAMQTLPAFVYLIPVLMFFGGNVVSAVIAIMIYSLPPIIRLTNLGIREVSGEAIEASHSFGATFRQTLAKVRVPLALPSIMMGVNQSVMMVLAMLIITPMIGGGGLGREVFLGLNTANTGVALQAGLAIVFLAIILDRTTQAWSLKRQKALGLTS